MKDAGFMATASNGIKAMEGMKGKAEAMGKGFAEGGREMIGMRERVEILRHSLETMGGPLAKLSDLTRMALDPMTLGFAAVFGAIELFQGGVERANKRAESFIESSRKVTDAIREINEARPSETGAWVAYVEQIAKLGEKFQDVKTFGENFLDMLRNSQSIQMERADFLLDIEIQKIKILEEQGRISQQDGDRRIANLKNQAVLQKNLAEQTNLKKQLTALTGEKSDLVSRAARQPGIESATGSKIKAENTVEDLKNQIEKIPKIIEKAEATAKLATAHAKETSQTTVGAVAKNAGLGTLGAIFGPVGLLGAGKNANLNQQEHNSFVGAAEQSEHMVETLRKQLESAKAQLPGAVAAAARADEDTHNATGAKERLKELDSQIVGIQNKLGQTVERQKALTPAQIAKNNLEAISKMATVPNSSHFAPSPTSLEKMGFVMSGQNNSLDYARRTAMATEKLAAEMSRKAPAGPPTIGQGMNWN